MSEVITAPTKNVKHTKTPRQYDSILKGALNLDLPDQVELKNQLIKSIENTVEKLKAAAEQAMKLAGQ